MKQANAGSNGASRKALHHLTTYSDEENKWLVQVDTEERTKGKGFMKR